jgi:hypothetical protein
LDKGYRNVCSYFPGILSGPLPIILCTSVC